MLRVRLTSVLAFLCLACVGGSEAPGAVELALATTSTSGLAYRLTNASFVVRGPETLTISTDELDPDELRVTTSLTPGNYTIQLSPGWILQRVEGGVGYTVRDAVLATPNRVPFVVAPGGTTSVAFGFRTSGESIDLDPSTLDLSIDVFEGPGAPTFVSSTLVRPVVGRFDAHDLVFGIPRGFYVVHAELSDTANGYQEFGGADFFRYDGSLSWSQWFGDSTEGGAVATTDPAGRLIIATFRGDHLRTIYVSPTTGDIIEEEDLPLPRVAQSLHAFSRGVGSAWLGAFYVGPSEATDHHASARGSQFLLLGRRSDGASYHETLVIDSYGDLWNRENDGRRRQWIAEGRIPPAPISIVHDDQGRAYVRALSHDALRVFEPTGDRYAIEGEGLGLPGELVSDRLGGAYATILRGTLLSGATVTLSGDQAFELRRYRARSEEPLFVRHLERSVIFPERQGPRSGYPFMLRASATGDALVLLLGDVSLDEAPILSGYRSGGYHFAESRVPLGEPVTSPFERIVYATETNVWLLSGSNLLRYRF